MFLVTKENPKSASKPQKRRSLFWLMTFWPVILWCMISQWPRFFSQQRWYCIYSNVDSFFLINCLYCLMQDMNSVCSNGCRIAKCMKEYFIHKKSYAGALNSTLLAKSLHQKLWDNSKYLLRQLPGIGMVTAKVFSAAFLVTVMIVFIDCIF